MDEKKWAAKVHTFVPQKRGHGIVKRARKLATKFRVIEISVNKQPGVVKEKVRETEFVT